MIPPLAGATKEKEEEILKLENFAKEVKDEKVPF